MKDENLYYNEWETAEEAVRRLKAGKVDEKRRSGCPGAF